MVKSEVNNLIKEYIQYLKKNNLNVERAYIFGSYAKGTYNDDSDIDLAVVFNEFPDRFDMQVKLLKLRRRFDTRIEPHPFRTSDFTVGNPFVSEILNTGLKVV